MINDHRSLARERATEHFRRARRRARFWAWLARLTGREQHLLPFDEIRTLLKQRNPMYRGIQPVGLNHIVGSVGRYRDFDRHFLPLKDSLIERWLGIETLAMTTGWPPIEVYLVGNIYFVKDGNHRVAVARQMELETIEAHVWEFPVEVTLADGETPDELLIRFGEENFMAATRLTEIRPEHGIRFTTPGRYTELLAQITELRDKLTLIDGVPPDECETVAAWYDLIYVPTVQIMRDTNLLAAFPGRTESDLFTWLSTHREQLRRIYGEYDHLSDLCRSVIAHQGEGALGRLWRRVRWGLGLREPAPLLALRDNSIPKRQRQS